MILNTTNTVINEIDNIYISIVMTTYNRVKQTLFTLSVINDLQKFKKYNIQIIIVDDSENSMVDRLRNYSKNIQIDYIYIDRTTKTWINPCINYNIGFKYILGEKIIIQNSEVCYVGDIIDFVKNTVIDNNYYVFDVKASSTLQQNENIYDCYSSKNFNTSIFNEPFFSGWYQNSIDKNYMMHFLVSITKESFLKIKGFDENYKDAIDYDDNDFLMKILYNNIKPINICNIENKLGGIHLFHEKIFYNKKLPTNEELFYKKLIVYIEHGVYIEDVKDFSSYNIPIIDKSINKQELIKTMYKKNNIW